MKLYGSQGRRGPPEASRSSGKPFFGQGEGAWTYGIKIDGIENDFPLKPLGRQEEWPRVQQFMQTAKSDWIGAKHATSGTAALKRWIKTVGPTQFYAKWTEGDDSFKVWYSGGEFGLNRAATQSRLRAYEGELARRQGDQRPNARPPGDVPESWNRIPPGAENAVPCRDAKAMVWYFPLGDTAYDVSRSYSATIEVCFASQEEGRRFFDTVVASGDVEAAELRFDDGKSPRGRLVDEYTEHEHNPARTRTVRRMRRNASDAVYIYQAALWCADDGAAIREDLTKAGKAPEDPDDENTYDSDEFPKGPYPDGGGEADSPQHCDAGADCLNAITLQSGHKIGQWLGNSLTDDGVRYVCEAVGKGGEVAELWADWYSSELADIGCPALKAPCDPDGPPIANPGEVEFFEDNRHVHAGPLFLMWFGQTGTTRVYVWADSFDSAFEEAVEWLDDNAPGHLVSLDESDLKNAAEDEGIEWQPHWPDWDDPKFQRVAEAAEADLTSIGHTTLKHGQYVASHEWGGDEVAKDSEEWNNVVACSYEEIDESEQAIKALRHKTTPNARRRR